MLNVALLAVEPYGSYVNSSCYQAPCVPRCRDCYYTIREPTLVRNIDQNYATCRTAVRENTKHFLHNRTVITNVNRHHWHTQRVVTNENNYHHYLTNNIIKVNDIHHQKIEHVPGEQRVFKDYKTTQTIEPPRCFRDEDGQVYGCTSL